MKILFLGDIVPGGVLPYQDGNPYSVGIAELFKTADFRVGTLETAFGDASMPFDDVKMKNRANIIYSPTETVKLLVDLRMDVVSLANNHVFDLSEEGLKTTLSLLDYKGIRHVGAGMNIEEAMTPASLELDNLRVSIIAGCGYETQYDPIPIATPNSAGVAPLDSSWIVPAIKKCKKASDYVVILPHWGDEYTRWPKKNSLKLSKEWINAGADLIIGSHPHCVQPTIRIQNKEVYFSIGNGLFPDFFMTPPRPIWYPNKEEVNLEHIPSTLDYPFNIQSPLRRNWREFSRIGEIVIATFSNTSINTIPIFSYLNNDNVLILKEQKQLAKKLNGIKRLIKMPFYDEGKLMNKILSILNKIKQ